MVNPILTFLESVSNGEFQIDGSEQYEFEAVQIEHETEKAWLIAIDEVFKKWFPKSRCELTPDGIFTIPGWLLTKIMEELKMI